jgi:chitin synthase
VWTGNGGRKLLNPLVAAQNVEYKISKILDKPLESLFRYVLGLPGAVFAYRYRAVVGRPLGLYFLEKDTVLQEKIKIYKNIYPAREILSLELVAKEDVQWTVEYIKSSKAEMAIPERVDELISHRGRRIIATYSAHFYELLHFRRLFISRRGFIRKTLFLIQVTYNLAFLIFQWFKVASVWLLLKVILVYTAQQKPIFGGATVAINEGMLSNLVY